MKLPKRDYRLLSSREFRAVYERGQKFNTPFFSAFVLSNDSGLQRMGLTTTRKIGGAVLRNRCRRRLREVFRLRDHSQLNGIGYDIVFNIKPTLAMAEYKEIEAAFSQTLVRFRRSLTDSSGRERAT